MVGRRPVGLLQRRGDDLNAASSTYADGDTNFTAEIDTRATNVYAYYPYDAGPEHLLRIHDVNLPHAQTQTAGAAGVARRPVCAVSAAAALVHGGRTVLSFTPAASLVAFDLYDAENNGESVKSVTFAPVGAKVNGNRYVDMTTAVPPCVARRILCVGDRDADNALFRAGRPSRATKRAASIWPSRLRSIPTGVRSP